jgi:cytochrome c-type biogenesis protein CcmH/NrfG
MSQERSRPRRPEETTPESTSFDDEAILQGYLARLMTMQDEQPKTWLEEEDLTSAARDLGLSDTDLVRIQDMVAGHKQRGRSFMERGLWDEAIDAFQQATTLDPFNADLFHDYAKAHLGRWRATGSEGDKRAAEQYAHRTLELDAEHTASYEILQELKRNPVRSGAPSAADQRTSKALVFFTLLALAVLAASLLIFLAL